MILVLLFSIQMLFYGSFYKAIKTKTMTNCAAVIIENFDKYGLNDSVKELIDVVSKRNDINIAVCKCDPMANYQKEYVHYIDDDCELKKFEEAVNKAPSDENKNKSEDDGYIPNPYNKQYVSAKEKGGKCIDVIEEPKEDLKELLPPEIEYSGELPLYERDGAERLIYSAIVFDRKNSEYLLLLESVVTPSRSTASTILFQHHLLFALLISISIAMTVIFSRMIAQPLVNINRTAKELGEGNYDVHFNGGGYREVEQLSETLNYATNELRQVDQMRRDLIANVSHDLRTPLTLITGYGEVMRDIPGENTPENVQIIIDEATRLSLLVNDLIDLSKIEAGTMKIEASVFCLTDTIKEMFGRYNKLKEQDGFSFTFEHDQNVYVYADKLKISQVVYNLVNNAVNYAGESKEITVRQICYDNRVRIEVIDNGPGIPQEKLKNIWDRYYKVDKSHKSAKIGTGLGLSIVKTVLKLHRAQYGVFSKVGKGTVFWFELYRTTEDGEPM